jgi:hypothetical protein
MQILTEKPVEIRLFIRPSRRWEDNINMDLRVWIGFSRLKIDVGDSSCEHGNEHSHYAKGGEFLDRLSNY